MWSLEGYGRDVNATLSLKKRSILRFSKLLLLVNIIIEVVSWRWWDMVYKHVHLWLLWVWKDALAVSRLWRTRRECHPVSKNEDFFVFSNTGFGTLFESSTSEWWKTTVFPKPYNSEKQRYLRFFKYCFGTLFESSTSDTPLTASGPNLWKNFVRAVDLVRAPIKSLLERVKLHCRKTADYLLVHKLVSFLSKHRLVIWKKILQTAQYLPKTGRFSAFYATRAAPAQKAPPPFPSKKNPPVKRNHSKK